MNYQVPKEVYSLLMRKVIFILLSTSIILSCSNSYSTLSFNNKSKSAVTVKYVQENGTILQQDIKSKEDLKLMFDKRWSDDNIRNVVNNIKEITIYTTKDTILHVSDKKALFNYFKQSRSMVKDNIDLKIVD